MKEIEELKLYRIEEEYAKYIYNLDEKVLIAYNVKNKRPFIGIILKINEIDYFAPLSSPKKKHEKMKNSIDFIKINNGRDGVINLNNMIPIPKEKYKEIDIKQEIQNNKKYGIILKYQIKWCNKNREKIIGNAQKLFRFTVIPVLPNVTFSITFSSFSNLNLNIHQFHLQFLEQFYFDNPHLKVIDLLLDLIKIPFLQ